MTQAKIQTGGRLKKVATYLKNEENFCFTYGDGVSDINISKSIKFHLKHKKLITIGAVQVPGRYGSLDCNKNEVRSFVEKSEGKNSYINGGFFVVSKKAIKYIEGEQTSWEEKTFKKISKKSNYGF